MRIGRALGRQLALRLGIGGAVIALALGGAVFAYELERIEDGFVSEALEQAKVLETRLPARLDQNSAPAVGKALAAFLAERRSAHQDHFIGVEIYDSQRESLAEVTAAEEVERSIDVSRHVFPETGDNWYLKHQVDGEVYLQVMIPLARAGGVAGGYFEGIYHVSRARLVEAGNGGLRTALLVGLAVLATSGLLYPIILQLHRNLVAGSRALLAANVGTIEALGSAIAKRDSDTNSHNYRVTLYALRLAEAAGLGPAAIRALIKGAFLHDVGKLAISDAILLKPGKLDDREFEIMKTHVTHGLDVVARLEWLHDATDVIACHHEKFDGSGYTAGLAGEQIPIIARVFAIADVFDALTSRRPYKAPLPVGEATAIMAAGRGTHFDPVLLDLFFALADDLHAKMAGRDDNALEHELREATIDYFTDALEG